MQGSSLILFSCSLIQLGSLSTNSLFDCLSFNLFGFTDSQPLAKYIASLDARYNSLFMDNVWKEAFEHSDTTVGESHCLS